MTLFVLEVSSFASQLVACLIIIGVIVAVFYCYLKQLAEHSDAEDETAVQGQAAAHSETSPILPSKEVVFSYGATEEQPGSSMRCASTEDLHSEKVCKICYDAARSCFFVPCGHGFTCFTCARRIVEAESKTCPICRRVIQRVGRLEIP
uniref:Uncharacterized protein n=3 Tax=Avena sativa TaxID=4498 RepID=A0ACD5ZR75_AVESA